ncbi:MAG TPA: hypothetical protein VFW75_10685 [Acetobacteraceae bacterium]|nr:hypothetical protein [Acetobacteraceae bacterium]
MDRDHELSTAAPIPAGTTEAAVFALLPTSAALDAAIKDLETAGFDRAELSLPEIDPPPDRATPEAGAEAADTDVEAQQSRLVHSGVGGAIGAMMAATAVAATGGVAAAVAGAAIGTGLVVGGVAHVISRAASNEEQADRDRKAAAGKLVLSVRAITPERQARAAELLRAAGAMRVW